MVFWIRKPSALFKHPFVICPFMKNLSTSDRYNALSRLIILIGLIMAIIQRSFYPLVVTALVLSIQIVFYYLSGQYKNDEKSGGGGPLPMRMNQTMVGLDTNPYVQQINYGKDTTITPCNPYGNPNAYNVCTAVNQRPLGCMEMTIPGDQFFDKFYNDTGQVAPGLIFNRIPDTTLMARGIYGVHSPEVQKIVGETSNPAFIAMR